MKSEFDLALERALAFLAKSDRFEAEVRKHLDRFDAATIELVIARLKGKGILDDARVIAGATRRRQGRKAVGATKLGVELRRRGADQALISAALDSRDETLGAMEALRGKFLTRVVDKPKAYRFLLSRGFDFDISAQVVDDFFKNNVELD